MLEIKTIATGSKGNAYLISEAGRHIMIDPGLPIRKLRKKTPVNLATLDLCLLSHEHKDHSRAFADLAKMGVKCACSSGTLAALWKDTDSIYFVERLKSETPVILADWQIMPFACQHDAAEPLGFLIGTPGGKKICYATDTYYLRYIFQGVTHWMIEANYSEDLLEKNTALDGAIKRRIRSSHFEIDSVVEFFRAQDLSATEEIRLIHLSDDNSDEKLFYGKINELRQ